MVDLKNKDTVYARLYDGINGGDYISLEVKDGKAPTVTVSLSEIGTNSIKATVSVEDKEYGMPDSPSYTFEIKETEKADSTYTQKETITGTSKTFTGLTQGISYTVRVTTKDKAGNEGKGTKGGTTKKVITAGSGNLTINTPTWSASTHKASVTITKGSSVSSNLKIQYQVNGHDATKWNNYGTSVGNLNHNDTVYARLYDGTNGGDYISLEVKDGKAPTVTVSLSEIGTNSIKATVSVEDKEYGMPDSPSYTFEIKETEKADSTYTQKETITGTSKTFTGLTQGISYTVRVTTKDKAGNEGKGTKGGTTKKVITAGSGNLTINTPTWSASTHKASVTITKGSSVSSNLKIQYQVNGHDATKWNNYGTSVGSLNHNDTVYARLYDGTNGGDYISLKVTDTTVPKTSTLTAGAVNNKTVTLTAKGADDQSGVAKYQIYVDGKVVSTQETGAASVTYSYTTTFGSVKAYVVVTDKAGKTTKSTEITITDNTIKTLDELKKFRDNVNGGTTYSGVTITQIANINLSGSATNQWTPIGIESHRFSGIYDGGNHSITNIYIDRTDSFQGLFGLISKGEVKNLTVSGNIKGGTQTGGIVGFVNGTITNCKNQCKITSYGRLIGGVAGDCYGKIINSANTGRIDCSNDYRSEASLVGGITGHLDVGGSIESCYNAGIITSSNPDIDIGGIVGAVEGNSSRGTTVVNCYNTGKVETGTGYYVGRNSWMDK